MLPGQTIPLTSHGIQSEVLSGALEKKYPYVGMLTADIFENWHPHVNVGVLVQVRRSKYQQQQMKHSFQVNTINYLANGFSFVSCARQRFKLLKRIEETEIETGTLFSSITYVSKADVEVLDEILLPPFHLDPACSFNRLVDKKIVFNLCRPSQSLCFRDNDTCKVFLRLTTICWTICRRYSPQSNKIIE